MGSGTPMNIPGYEGTDNVYFWLKLTDMFLLFYLHFVVCDCCCNHCEWYKEKIIVIN